MNSHPLNIKSAILANAQAAAAKYNLNVSLGRAVFNLNSDEVFSFQICLNTEDPEYSLSGPHYSITAPKDRAQDALSLLLDLGSNVKDFIKSIQYGAESLTGCSTELHLYSDGELVWCLYPERTETNRPPFHLCVRKVIFADGLRINVEVYYKDDKNKAQECLDRLAAKFEPNKESSLAE